MKTEKSKTPKKETPKKKEEKMSKEAFIKKLSKEVNRKISLRAFKELVVGR